MPVVCTKQDRNRALDMFERVLNRYFNATVTGKVKYVPELEQLRRYAESKGIEMPTETAEVAKLAREFDEYKNSDSMNYMIAETVAPEFLGDQYYDLRSLWDQFRFFVLDEIAPTKKIGTDTYEALRLHAGVDGISDVFLQDATFGYDKAVRYVQGRGVEFAKKGEGFLKILEPHKDELQEFSAYLVSKRYIDLAKRVNDKGERLIKGINDVKLANAEDFAKKHGERFEKSAQKINEYNRHLLEYYRDSGMLSAESFDAITKANEFYIPLYRVLDAQAKAQRSGKSVSPEQIIRRIEGSELLVHDPLVSMMGNTVQMINIAERNRIGRTMVADLAKNPGAAQYMRLKDGKIDVQQLARQFKDIAAVDPELLKNIPDELLGAFTSNSWLDDTGHTIKVWENGKAKEYVLDKDIFEALKGKSSGEAGLMWKMLSFPKRLLQKGVTLDPGFNLAALAKDSQDAYVYSRYGINPAVDLPRGLAEAFKGNSDLYLAWKASGGSYAGRWALDRKSLHKQLIEYTQDQANMNPTRLVSSMFRGLEKLGNVGEESLRLIEFEKALAKGESLDKAALASRQVTLDFASGGRAVKQLNELSAFFNAFVQGNYKFFSEAIGLASGQSQFKTPEDRRRFAIKAISKITLPSLMLALQNQDQEWYKELPQYRKSLFWNFKPTEDSPIISIPKPQDLGLWFANMPEAFLEMAKDKDPQAVKDLLREYAAEFAFDRVLPTGVRPIIEDFANRSIFSDQPIIPHALDSQLAAYQLKPYTSSVAKTIGGLVAAGFGDEASFSSPLRIDHYLNAYLGNTYRTASKLIDGALEKTGAIKDVRPASHWYELPVIKTFFTAHPEMSSQSVRDYFDIIGDAKKWEKTINSLVKSGRADEAERLIKQKKHLYNKPSHTAVMNMVGLASKIRAMPPELMSPQEKRQKLDELYIQLTTFTQMLLEQSRQK